jgi:hypothetical protein
VCAPPIREPHALPGPPGVHDVLVLATLLLAFATLVTAHVTLAIGLARRSRSWRSLVALLVVPMAPWWGWRERMRVRAAVWVVAAAVYAIARVAADR